MNNATMNTSLIRKYNVPGPRYTSYPTVPYWEDNPTEKEWKSLVKGTFESSNLNEGISLYIHLPFCENLCTFCGCHKRITKQHSVEQPYIETVLQEWKLYCDMFGRRPELAEIHLGGGTPTFFSPDRLKQLIDGIFELADKHDRFQYSFEGHPNNTTKEHLQTFYDLGFKRNSFGVQDYDPKVQKTINRIQPFEQVKMVTELSREIGYESVSHDLVFGLPHQTKESIVNTIERTAELMPDRIAFYSYAHVPWIKGVGQRGFNENDLPQDEEKRELYELGKKMFFDLGYVEIGMDHFALKTDEMFKAMEDNSLHRNFMGYTVSKTELMIGLGMSSISDSWNCFAQNVKTVEEYTELVNNGQIPIFRGHKLSAEDLVMRQHILDIMCHFETKWEGLNNDRVAQIKESLQPMEEDGLLVLSEDRLQVTEIGKPFVRNICMCFDLRMLKKQPQTRIFSSTI